jgi:hypothetical protein
MLREVLVWLLTGGASGGAGVVTYWLMENIRWLAEFPDARWKRVIAFGLSASIAILAYLAAVGLGYEPALVTWQAWVERLFAVAMGAASVSQMIHAMRDLPSAADAQVAERAAARGG